MRRRLGDLTRQCRDAWTQAQCLSLDGLAGNYNQVVISGMGGSAIAGDLVCDLSALNPGVPVVVARSLQLPFQLDRGTLFISCSHSGNTQETLSLFRAAADSDASMVAITAGGALAQEAAAQGATVVPVNAPGEPRSAVGYNLVLLLGLLHRLGLAQVEDADISAAESAINEQLALFAESAPAAENPAKQLAAQLAGKLLVVFGGGIFSGAARRWKAQLNENAKVWAFYENIPECLHNSVESFGAVPDPERSVFALLLQPSTMERELADRYRTLAEMLEGNGVEHCALAGIDGPPLAQLLSMILLGDYVSYYLALLQGLDPSPTPAIDRSKAMLR